MQAETFRTDNDCDRALQRLGSISRELALIDAGKARNVAKVAREAEERASPLIAEKDAIEAQVINYVKAHRERLTEGFRTKTATFPAGEVSFRMGRPRVVVDTSLTAKIIARLKALGLGRMIRVKEELDRTAIAKEPKAFGRIPGLSVEAAEEEVLVKPLLLGLAERAEAA